MNFEKLRRALRNRPAPVLDTGTEAARDATETWREAFEERAAILEYCSDLSREEAEREAARELGITWPADG